MKRFFASDAESDMLIAEATKTFGLKIGDIINMAIKNQFLPITEPFRTEARFILQRHTEGALEAQEIKQSMTRGIRALGTRPVRDADRLQGFFARYHLHEDVENCTITENDALWESAVEVSIFSANRFQLEASAKLTVRVWWMTFLQSGILCGAKRLCTMCWRRLRFVASRTRRSTGLRACSSLQGLSMMQWASGAVHRVEKNKT